MYQRFRDWRDDGTFDHMLEGSNISLNQDGPSDLDTGWSIPLRYVQPEALQVPGKKGLDHARDAVESV